MPNALDSVSDTPTRRIFGASLLFLLAVSSSGTAGAADFSLGIGVGADRGHVDCIESMPCDRSSDDVKLFAAYQVDPSVDVRLSWFDHGRFKGGDVTPLGTEFGGNFKVSAFALTVGYLWNVAPSWSLHLQAGLASVHTRFEYASPFAGSVGMSTTQPIAGLSIGYAVTPAVRIGLDYDITRFRAHQTKGSMQTLGVSAQYTFD